MAHPGRESGIRGTRLRPRSFPSGSVVPPMLPVKHVGIIVLVETSSLEAMVRDPCPALVNTCNLLGFDAMRHQ